MEVNLLTEADRKMFLVLCVQATLLELIRRSPTSANVELARGVMFLPKTLAEIRRVVEPNAVPEELEFCLSFIDAPDQEFVSEIALEYETSTLAKIAALLAKASPDMEEVLYSWLRSQ
jgi:hypothetical protein